MDINLKFGEAEPLTPEEIEYFDSQEKLNKLPKKIKILWGDEKNSCSSQLNKTFEMYAQKHNDPDFGECYSIMYDFDGEMPPIVPQYGTGLCCFLVSMGSTYNDAKKDMLERLEKSRIWWVESK